MHHSHQCLDMDILSMLVSSAVDTQAPLHLITAIIDDIDAVMCAKDKHGRHFIINKYYEKTCGKDRKDILGKTDSDIFSYDSATAKKIREKDLQVMASKSKISFEEKIPHRNGGMRYYLTKKSPIISSNGEILGVMCLAIDVSKQKSLEHKLQRATKAKNLFLAKMSHEIRTPISAISGYLDLINYSDNVELNKNYLNNISISVDHLLSLVDDILDISSIEENKISLEKNPFSLTKVIDSVISTLTLRAKQNDVSIRAELNQSSPTDLMGDETRVKQIIFNLVSNAIKFSKNSAVDIRVSITNCRLKNHKKITILVKDQGIGIDTTQRDKIYQAFTQLNESAHYFEGTGLGLAIAKELVHLMHGNIKIFSTLGEGTIVATYIYLEEMTCSDKPQEKAPPVLSHSKMHSVKPLQDKVICIAEDQVFNREILKNMAINEGAEVIAFEDGIDLIEAIQNQTIPKNIDCFLLDVHMPKLSGLETLSKIRKYPEYANTVAYLVTADAVKDNLERYWTDNYSLTGIYIKPMTRQQLIDSVLNQPIST